MKKRGRKYGKGLSHSPSERPDAGKGEKGRRQRKERRGRDEGTHDRREGLSRLEREREGDTGRRDGEEEESVEDEQAAVGESGMEVLGEGGS